MVEAYSLEEAVAFDSDVSLSSDCGVCDDEAGTAFDGFLKTTMLGVWSVGVYVRVSRLLGGL